METAPDACLTKENVQLLRVDDEAGLALLRVACRMGAPGRTRWSFLFNLPPGLLEGKVAEQEDTTTAGALVDELETPPPRSEFRDPDAIACPREPHQTSIDQRGSAGDGRSSEGARGEDPFPRGVEDAKTDAVAGARERVRSARTKGSRAAPEAAAVVASAATLPHPPAPIGLESPPSDADGYVSTPTSDGEKSDYSPGDLEAISPEIFAGDAGSLARPTPAAEFVDAISTGMRHGHRYLHAKPSIPDAGRAAPAPGSICREFPAASWASASSPERCHHHHHQRHDHTHRHHHHHHHHHEYDDDGDVAAAVRAMLGEKKVGGYGFAVKTAAAAAPSAATDKDEKSAELGFRTLSVADTAHAEAWVDGPTAEGSGSSMETWGEGLSDGGGAGSTDTDDVMMRGFEAAEHAIPETDTCLRDIPPPALLPPRSSGEPPAFTPMETKTETEKAGGFCTNSMPPLPPPQSQSLGDAAAAPPAPTPPTRLASAAPSVPVLACRVEGLRFRRSGACLGGGGGQASGQGRGEHSAGLGVFSERSVRKGGVVFEEEALLQVDKGGLSAEEWEAIVDVVRQTSRLNTVGRMAAAAGGSVDKLTLLYQSLLKGFVDEDSFDGLGGDTGVVEMDLAQVLAFERADASVQERVLGLFAPPREALSGARRDGWWLALERLYERGVLGGGGSLDGDGWGFQGGVCEGAGGVGGVRVPQGGEKRRLMLMRVLGICDANIFGEYDDEEEKNGPRSLFEVGCRINHSCLPNCTYVVKDGKITVRALIDLEAGTELLVSYLSMEDVMADTRIRRQKIFACKYFDCWCARCSTRHDFSRGMRCPRCFKGPVYPPSAPHPPRTAPGEVGETCAGSGSNAASGVSACTACGGVPTTGWLASAERLEGWLLDDLDKAASQPFSPSSAAVVARAYPAALYLLWDDHHGMYVIHEALAINLEGRGRADEAAYHYHEMLVACQKVFPRPSPAMAVGYENLATCLGVLAGFVTPGLQTPNDQWFPPLGGRFGRYTGLVQTPPPPRFAKRSRATRAAGDDPTAASATLHRANNNGEGRGLSEGCADCEVCGRLHGHPCDACCVGRGWGGDKMDWLSYAGDCERMMLKAADGRAVLVGPDAPSTLILLKRIQYLKKLVSHKCRQEGLHRVHP